MPGPVVIEQAGGTVTTYLPGAVQAVRVVPPKAGVKAGWGVDVLTCAGWESVGTATTKEGATQLYESIVDDASEGDAPAPRYAKVRKL